MNKTLPILILASLATVASPYSLADDPTYGTPMPDKQALPDPDLTPGASTNSYNPQTEPAENNAGGSGASAGATTSTYPYQPMQQRDNRNPAIQAFPTRQDGPNAPAHQEDYAP